MVTKRPPSTYVLPGDPPVEVVLRRSARAKRYSLRVSRTDGRVSLSLPTWAPEAEALAFLRDREGWLRRHLDRTPEGQAARIGAVLPVLGADHEIVAGNGRAASFEGATIAVPPGPRQGPRVKALLSGLARARLAEAVARYAATLGRVPGKLTLRDPRTRWGSCSSKGDLMFSWRLVMTPPEVLDYVAAHEVAHLIEMNHSDRFWAVCAGLCPDYRVHRTWLRKHGPALLAWNFAAGEAGDAD